MRKGRLSEDKVTEMYELYKQLGNVWAVAKVLGKCGQSVHEVLSRRGLINKMNIFSQDDYDFLVKNYLLYRDSGRLTDLANEMGRTKHFVCRKAKELGLTDVKYKFSDTHIEAIKESSKNQWVGKIHPKGMLGKNHTAEVRLNMSERAKRLWANPKSKFNSLSHRAFMSNRMSDFQINNPNKSNNYSRTKKGWFVKDGQKIAMRSSWEFNYAHFLNKLVLDGKIKSWEYEAKSFKFPKLIFGCRTYTPDFLVIKNDDTIIYHEVKGWMDEKSILKIKLMKKYFPKVKLKIIDEMKYKAIEKNKNTIPNWGEWITKQYDDKPRTEIEITLL
jgi:hypothetical protein